MSNHGPLDLESETSENTSENVKVAKKKRKRGKKKKSVPENNNIVTFEADDPDYWNTMGLRGGLLDYFKKRGFTESLKTNHM